jgi:hypothetical protein
MLVIALSHVSIHKSMEDLLGFSLQLNVCSLMQPCFKQSGFYSELCACVCTRESIGNSDE